jgi:hypothetical protein
VNKNTNDYKTFIPEYDIIKDNKKDILSYLDLILNNLLSDVKHRTTAQYLLDKLVTYEKYKNEYF